MEEKDGKGKRKHYVVELRQWKGGEVKEEEEEEVRIRKRGWWSKE